jgi:hypothetical protein
MLHVLALLAVQVLPSPPPLQAPMTPCLDSSLCSKKAYACFAKFDRCAPLANAQFLLVRIESDDSVTVGTRRIALTQLPEFFRNIALKERVPLRVEADPKAHYGTVAQVLADARRAGLPIQHSSNQ